MQLINKNNNITKRLERTQVKKMENLQKVCDLLTETLKETRNLGNLKELHYDKSTETVTATFECGGTKMAKVTGDSGTSMISDIIKQIL